MKPNIPSSEQSSLITLNNNNNNVQPLSSSSIPDVNAISPTQVIPKSPFTSCCTYKHDLTVLEYSKYIELKTQCLIPYDNNNEVHSTDLHKLYDTAYTLYQNTNQHDSNNNNNFTYKTLGFQTTTNPHTDFRNGGYISLLIMLHYINAYEREFNETFHLKYFAFAITCINVVNDIKTFLRLITDDEIRQIEQHKMSSYTITTLCNRQQIKCFLKALNENDILFYEIVSLALTQVIMVFKQNYNEDKKEQNYLMINDLIKQSVNNVGKALLTCSTADEIINALKMK